ncbi:flavodoxin family protein [Anaerofilum sp. BX8]|uniref:Flavodoxin family protein n=1 Tax=Anaerofilum hominis TaxID=2763016 RepID=A0A923L284_9FIRM|nr:flavodoxin family protein [Anaerofilum hominis]MBC5582518.1 flavodoxin family protein [Anaerofilum hominis]
MKTIWITELDCPLPAGDAVLDLKRRKIRPCTGCWACWVRTPGRCAQRDLDDFYRSFVNAERAVFLPRPRCGFVSGDLKNLFDRMIPLALPYISYQTGESMHAPRYARLPGVEVRYEDAFERQEDRQLFCEYLERVFYQFGAPLLRLEPIGKGGPQG